MASEGLLIGDIGGTNARFAIAEKSGAGYSQAKTLRCDEFANATLAIQAYLNGVGIDEPAAICLAVAGPVENGCVSVTNNHWELDTASLREEFKTTAIRLINDFEAIACAVPLLGANDFLSLGSPARCDLKKASFTIAVVGPGTGFGAVGLCQRGDNLFPIAGEMGHVGFSPETPPQLHLFGELARKYGRVSMERLLSGPGIENIYRILSQHNDGCEAEIPAADVFAYANDASDPCAVETVQIFFEALGQVAGDLALLFGAADGIYIAGGIVQRYPEMLAASHFRRGFENKGRQKALMEKIPTQLITHPQPGLLGASHCLGVMD